MFFDVEKFKRRVIELGDKRYVKDQCIAPFISMLGTLPEDKQYHEVQEKVEGSEWGLNDFFIGRDKYLWLEKEVTVPKKKDGFEVIGLFDFGRIDTATKHGFESMLYVNGKLFQGVDHNHKEVIFTGKEGEKLKLTFLLWSGLENIYAIENKDYNGSSCLQCRKAEFAYLHNKTDELYFFVKAITETLAINKSDEQYYDLIELLDRTFHCIDWDGSSFYETIDSAHEMLMNGLAKMEKRTDVTVHAVGHTHIDVAWLWRLKHTREKAQRSFSSVLRLMERYDEYIFLQTQPQLYQYIKEDCPELYQDIKKKVAEGKWEPEGGMWVEADCNISSGEALVRQFLHGTRFIEQEFGKKCEYLWLPDVFGYSWALPQILKQCEIDTFMTTKIGWNQFNSMPDDIFWWRGIDGTEILSYFVDIPDDIPSMGLTVVTYNCQLKPKEAVRGYREFKNKDLTKDILICYGFGDGGGGPTREMLEMRKAMDKIPGLPHVKTGKAGEFFRKIHENVENTERYVHTWDGELYLEYHRGTYTTQAYNKKTNRRMENKLAQIEWLSSLYYVLSGVYEQKELHNSWECVLLHQFHDIIPGSSIHEVYEDSHVNYEKAEKIADEVKEHVMEELVQESEHTYSVYSTNSFGGKELVCIPEYEDGTFSDSDGRILPAQKTENGYEVLVETEPFAAVNVTFSPAKESVAQEYTGAAGEENNTFFFNLNGIETPYYYIQWNEDGQITSMFDKEADRHVLKEGQQGNVLEFYEDKPMEHDAWDIDIYYTRKKPENAKLEEKPEVVECGELKAVIRFCYSYRASRICQDMIVYRDSRRIDFKTHVDWKESHKLLKVAFPVDIRSTKATYDIQFGHVERATHWNNSWDWARFEVCSHKWADLSEKGYGVSLLNDCKYGYNIKDNIMKLSLLKSSKWPDHSADIGEHDFIYSLLPHMGTLHDGGTIEEANRLNLPPQVIAGTFVDTRKIVKVSSDSVQLDVVKKAEDEDCLIVRLHECRGGKTKVTLSSEFPMKRMVPCNLLEHDTGDALDGAKTEFTINPFEIKTFKLYF